MSPDPSPRKNDAPSSSPVSTPAVRRSFDTATRSSNAMAKYHDKSAATDASSEEPQTTSVAPTPSPNAPSTVVDRSLPGARPCPMARLQHLTADPNKAKPATEEAADPDRVDTIIVTKSATVPLNLSRDKDRTLTRDSKAKPSGGQRSGVASKAMPAANPTIAQASTVAVPRIRPSMQSLGHDGRSRTASSTTKQPAFPFVGRDDASRAGRSDARVSTTPIAPSTSLHPPTSSPATGKNKSNLRRGKWTTEEEAYVARIIKDFNSGFLNAPAGTTLRSYLSEKLRCDPMRITKKFTGDACIGKRVFHPAVRSASNAAAIDKAQSELDSLERRWRRRLELQQRESAKKAAASAAAHASSMGRPHVLLPKGPLHSNSGSSPESQAKQQVVTQTASWLDRANAILKTETSATSSQAGSAKSASSKDSNGSPNESVTSAEIENQMKEVQRLIYEGPYIQQTSVGLPHLLDQKVAHRRETSSSVEPSVSHSLPNGKELSAPDSPPSEHLDKRMRSSQDAGTEDAEALVGFLRSVRASAASGQTL